MTVGKNNRRSKEKLIYQNRFKILILTLIMITGIIAGCSRKPDNSINEQDADKQVVTHEPSHFPGPTISPSPIPTPTPIPFSPEDTPPPDIPTFTPTPSPPPFNENLENTDGGSDAE